MEAREKKVVWGLLLSIGRQNYPFAESVTTPLPIDAKSKKYEWSNDPDSIGSLPILSAKGFSSVFDTLVFSLWLEPRLLENQGNGRQVMVEKGRILFGQTYVRAQMLEYGPHVSRDSRGSPKQVRRHSFSRGEPPLISPRPHTLKQFELSFIQDDIRLAIAYDSCLYFDVSEEGGGECGQIVLSSATISLKDPSVFFKSIGLEGHVVVCEAIHRNGKKQHQIETQKTYLSRAQRIQSNGWGLQRKYTWLSLNENPQKQKHARSSSFPGIVMRTPQDHKELSRIRRSSVRSTNANVSARHLPIATEIIPDNDLFENTRRILPITLLKTQGIQFKFYNLKFDSETNLILECVVQWADFNAMIETEWFDTNAPPPLPPSPNTAKKTKRKTWSFKKKKKEEGGGGGGREKKSHKVLRIEKCISECVKLRLYFTTGVQSPRKVIKNSGIQIQIVTVELCVESYTHTLSRPYYTQKLNSI